MAEPRFLLDEHVAAAVAAQLRRRGLDALTAVEAGLRGASDVEYLERANVDGRIVVTHDGDFLRLHQAGRQHSGIVYCAQGTRTIGQIVGSLVLIHDLLDAAEMIGRVEFV